MNRRAIYSWDRSLGLEALTKRDVGDSSNCYTQDGKKLRDVGDVVRVNLPTTIIPTNPEEIWKRNYMHVKLWNLKISGGNLECCESEKLKLVDKAIDGLGPEIVLVFWEPKFTRDSRCVINGWATCPQGRSGHHDNLG